MFELTKLYASLMPLEIMQMIYVERCVGIGKNEVGGGRDVRVGDAGAGGLFEFLFRRGREVASVGTGIRLYGG